MREYRLVLTMDGENLTTQPSRLFIGSEYDNNAHQLRFVRPESLAGHDLILRFKGKNILFAPVNRGGSNTFILPNILMLSENLTLQIGFQKDQYMLHANPVPISIRASLTQPVALEPWPLPVGPPGEPGKAPYIHLETETWQQWDPAADSYVDTGVKAQGLAGPAGPRGPAGADGIGIAGPAGRDGLTTSVNGIEQVGGEITLTADNIPYRGSPTAEALDKVVPLAERRVLTGNPVTLTTDRANMVEAVTIFGHTARLPDQEPVLGSPVRLQGLEKLEVQVNKISYTLPTAPLWGSGALRDEISTAGSVTRRWGIRVLDGTEAWYSSSTVTAGKSRFGVDFPDNKPLPQNNNVLGPSLCTHYPIRKNDSSGSYGAITSFVITNTQYLYIYDGNHDTTVEDFKAWLAAQYAAGTPVTIVYPLAESITETFLPIPIDTPQGTVTITGPGELRVITPHYVTTRDLQGQPSISYGTAPPSGGKDRDLYFRQAESGALTLYLNCSGVWVHLGEPA